MKVVYIGKEGSGKSTLMACDSYELVHRNVNWAKKTGKVRPIVSNLQYSKHFEDFAREKGVPIRYWKDIEELETLTECDLIIDEVGAVFDSRSFADLPLSTRLWLAQADKLGVHIYAGAQDWAQIDVSFRRLVKRLYEIKKVLGTRRPSQTRPGAKNPWAIMLRYKVAPEASSDSAELKTLSVLPMLHIFGKKAFTRFDTNARIRSSEAPPLKRVVRTWTNPETGRVEHTQIRYY